MKRFRQTLIAFLIVVPSIGVGCSLYRSLTATPSHSISLANGKFSVQGEENQDLPMLGQQADGGLCSIPTVEITNFSPQVLVDQETTIQFDPAAQLDGNTFLLVGHAGSIPAVSACHLTNEQIQAFQIFSIHLDPGENAFSFSLNFPAEIALAFAFQSPSGSIQVTSVIHISVTSVIQTGNPTYVFAAVGDMGRPDTTGTPLGSGNGNGSGLGGGVYSRTLLERIHAAGAQFLILLGDFDYGGDPTGFQSIINGILGDQFPILAVRGNHDYNPQYEIFEDTIDQFNLINCHTPASQLISQGGPGGPSDPIGDRTCTVGPGHLTFVINDDNPYNHDASAWVSSQFSQYPAKFRFFVKHMTRELLSTYKSDEFPVQTLEAVRQAGAINLNGHSHSALLTYLLNDAHTLNIETTSMNFSLGPGKFLSYDVGTGGWQYGANNNCITPQTPSNPNPCPHVAKILANNMGQPSTAAAVIFEVFMEDNPPLMKVRLESIHDPVDGPYQYEAEITSGH